MPTRTLLEACPGAGKTTAIRRLAALLRTREAVGFTTQEIREGGTRVGFALENQANHQAITRPRQVPPTQSPQPPPVITTSTTANYGPEPAI